MDGGFDRLVGAAGDVRELEYVAAMHQTSLTEEDRGCCGCCGRRDDDDVEDGKGCCCFCCGGGGGDHGEGGRKGGGGGGGGGGGRRAGGGALGEHDEGVRLDGSIRAEDIRWFLSSRYGIAFQDESDVARAVIDGFNAGGGRTKTLDSDGVEVEDEDVLDLMELVAVLLIPALLKSAAAETAAPQQRADGSPKEAGDCGHDAGRSGLPPGTLGFVLKMILHDATGSSAFDRPLDAGLLKEIFTAYGETDVAANAPLLKRMVELAKTSTTTTTTTGVLDPAAFAAGLTNDVLLYDVANEDRCTTSYDDVFGNRDERRVGATAGGPRIEGAPGGGGGDAEDPELQPQDPQDATMTTVAAAGGGGLGGEKIKPGRHKFLAASIDVTAGLYRSQALTVCLWTTMLISYYAYVYMTASGSLFTTTAAANVTTITPAGEVVSGEVVVEGFCDAKYVVIPGVGGWIANGGAIACDTAQQIFGWLAVFFLISLLGVVFLSLGSTGNYDGAQLWKPWFGALVCVLFVSIPYILAYSDSETHPSRPGMTLDNGSALHLCHVAAILIQRQRNAPTQNRILSFLLPTSSDGTWCCLPCGDRVAEWLSTGPTRGEMHLKRAAAHKVAQMARNALDIVSVIERDRTSLNTYYAQALGEYDRSGKKYESGSGALLWCVRRMWSGQLFREEGIWFSSRIIASNVAQWIVTIYLLSSGIKLTRYVNERWDEEDFGEQYLREWVQYFMNTTFGSELVMNSTGAATDVFADFLSSQLAQQDQSAFTCPQDIPATEMVEEWCTSTVQATPSASTTDVAAVRWEDIDCSPAAAATDFGGFRESLCPLLADDSNSLGLAHKLALLNASGYDVSAMVNVTRTTALQAADRAVEVFYPSDKYMVVVPMTIATACAFLMGVYLAVSYIPSVTKTILMLRCGSIPTMHNRYFNRYRVAADQVAILFGSLFWGTFFSSVLLGGSIGAIIFLFLWQPTVFFVQRFVAIVIGFLLTILIRLAIVSSFRCSFYKAFYRTRPAGANLSVLALEWATIALSAGYIFVRMVKLLVLAASSVSRIDRHFLAEGVGRIGRIDLDCYPTVHTKGLLSQEAHRHPYIELLGAMYMMRVRYGERFASQAGSTWRLLFVYALFPWLHQYRVRSNPQQLSDGGLSQALSKGKPSFGLDFKSLRHLVESRKTQDDKSEKPRAPDGSHPNNIDEHLARGSPSSPLKPTTEPEDSNIGEQGRSPEEVIEEVIEFASSQQGVIRQLEMENTRLRMALSQDRATKLDDRGKSLNDNATSDVFVIEDFEKEAAKKAARKTTDPGGRRL